MGYKFSTRSLTLTELDNLYGDRVIEPGKYFKIKEHYYYQREDDVLHITKLTINNLHPGYLNKKADLIEITAKEFVLKIKEVIYDLDINDYLVVAK